MKAPLAVSLNLVAAAIGGEFNRVQIDRPAIRVPEGDRGGQPISNHLKSFSQQDGVEPRYGCRVHYEIEVGVVPGLPLEKSVDPPPAVDPSDDALSLRLVENMQYLVTPHSAILADAVCSSTGRPI
jgi:hypothetical protein